MISLPPSLPPPDTRTQCKTLPKNWVQVPTFCIFNFKRRTGSENKDPLTSERAVKDRAVTNYLGNPSEEDPLSSGHQGRCGHFCVLVPGRRCIRYEKRERPGPGGNKVGYIGYRDNSTMVYWGYIGIMENKMETTIICKDFIAISIVGRSASVHLNAPLTDGQEGAECVSTGEKACKMASRQLISALWLLTRKQLSKHEKTRLADAQHQWTRCSACQTAAWTSF